LLVFMNKYLVRITLIQLPIDESNSKQAKLLSATIISLLSGSYSGFHLDRGQIDF
jgi:hypothetical protein